MILNFTILLTNIELVQGQLSNHPFLIQWVMSYTD